MQFTTVRSKEKDCGIYLKSKNCSQPVNFLAKVEKTGSSYFEPDKHCCNYLEREKSGYAIWRPKNVVHNCQNKGKRLRYLFKVRKTGSQSVGAQKKSFPAIWKLKKLVPSYFEPHKHCCSCLEREKSGSLLFGDQKMQFTTVRSKEKDYDIYLKSEKLVHSQQEHEKKCFPAIQK